MTATITGSFADTVLNGETECVTLGHGSGGTLSRALLKEHFLPHFGGTVLRRLGDAAVVTAGVSHVVLSTNTFVVNPLEFAGGNIGSLAINGTVNNLAMMGAQAYYITVGFVIEEGLPLAVLDRVIASMAEAARIARVEIVAGDTKVVERGKGDGLFVNTTGLGFANTEFRPRASGARAGDIVLVSGPLGLHGATILSAREGLALDAGLESDTAALFPLVERLRRATDGEVSALRDPTRGGVAAALSEIATASGVGVEIDESSLPIPAAVGHTCDLLGLDPLHVANQGTFIAFVPESCADAALLALRSHPLGAGARRIGVAVAGHPGLVVLRTTFGRARIVDLPNDALPRIC